MPLDPVSESKLVRALLQLLAAWQERVAAEHSVHTEVLERTLQLFADQGLLIN